LFPPFRRMSVSGASSDRLYCSVTTHRDQLTYSPSCGQHRWGDSSLRLRLSGATYPGSPFQMGCPNGSAGGQPGLLGCTFLPVLVSFPSRASSSPISLLVSSVFPPPVGQRTPKVYSPPIRTPLGFPTFSIWHVLIEREPLASFSLLPVNPFLWLVTHPPPRFIKEVCFFSATAA